MDYICRLVPLQEQVKDKILIVPRIYTNKPRTDGAGYKLSLIHSYIQKDIHLMGKRAVLQPQANLLGIGDAGAPDRAVDLLLNHGEMHPCDCLLDTSRCV